MLFGGLLGLLGFLGTAWALYDDIASRWAFFMFSSLAMVAGLGFRV